MKKLLTLLAALFALTGWGANPAFTDFDTNQFNTAGNKVPIKTGAFITNEVAFGTLTVQDHFEATNATSTNTIAGKLQGGTSLATSSRSVAFGLANANRGTDALVSGEFNTNQSIGSIVSGRGNSVQSSAVYSQIGGLSNQVSSRAGLVSGTLNIVEGANTVALGSNIFMNGGIATCNNDFISGVNVNVGDGVTNTFIHNGDPNKSLSVDPPWGSAFIVNAPGGIVFTNAPIVAPSGFIGPFYGSNLVGSYVGVSGASPYTVSNLWSVVLPDGATAFQLGNPGAGYAAVFATNFLVTPDGAHYAIFTQNTNTLFGGDVFVTNGVYHGKSFRPQLVAATIVGATAQSTNLMEIQGGTSNILAYVDKDGVFSGNGAGLTNQSATATGRSQSRKLNEWAGSTTANEAGRFSVQSGNALVANGASPKSGNLSVGLASTLIATNAGGVASHPGMTMLPDGRLLVLYTEATAEGATNSTIEQTISTDQGATWSTKTTVYTPAANHLAIDPEVMVLRNGNLLATFMVQNQFGEGDPSFTSVILAMTGVMQGDGSIAWQSPVGVSNSLAPFSGVVAKAVELTNGTLMLPIYGPTNDSVDSVAVVFSTDNGATWGGTVHVAAGTFGVAQYDESAMVQLASGRIIGIVRKDVGGNGYSRVVSDDNGATWSAPSVIWSVNSVGKPSLALLASGGLLLCARTTNGTDFVTSWDEGATWSSLTTLSGFTGRYQSVCLLSGGSVGVAYAGEGGGSTTTRFQELYDGSGIFGRGVMRTKQLFADQNGGNALVVNSSGTDLGFVSSPAANTFSLGTGTSKDALGTSRLAWNSAGVFVNTLQASNTVTAKGDTAAIYALNTANALVGGIGSVEWWLGSGSDNTNLAIGATDQIKLYPGNSSTAALTINNSGIVDINATSTDARLNVGGTIYSTVAPGNAFMMTSAGTDFGFIQNDNANIWSLGHGAAAGTLGTSVLSWNASNNVGIGKTNPVAKLDVAGDGQFISSTRMFRHSSTNTVITNTATLTGNEWTAGQEKYWFNGATTITLDKTNGAITANGLINGAYGSLAMGTGAVTIASGTLMTNVWSYSSTSGSIGVETNTTLVVTNAGNYFISFGSLIAGANTDVLNLKLVTNGVPVNIVKLSFTCTAQSTSETGFKEFAIALPAMCRVGLNPTNTLTAANMTIQNTVLNVKGAN